MKKLLTTLATVVSFAFGLTAQSASTFINEVNYLASNPSQGIEIAGQAGQDLEGWSVAIYAVNGTVSYVEYLNSRLIPNQQNGYGAIWYDVDQGSGGKGIALINPNGEVVQFLSYGTIDYINVMIQAVDGPAYGMTSEYIGTQLYPEASLELTGLGLSYLDFIWAVPGGNTAGAINTNQIFGSPINPSNYALPAPGNSFPNTSEAAIAIEIFPNPTVDIARVKVSAQQPDNIRYAELFDAYGRLLKKVAIASDDTIDFDLSNCEPGIYAIRATNGTAQVTKPIVKAKR